MKELIAKCETNYYEHIKTNGGITDEKLRGYFLSLLEEESLNERERLWKDFQLNINSIKQLPELANPLFIGFGNPKSDLLFVGKEKGFDIYNNPRSFFNESINNILQWKLIDENKLLSDDMFNPENPRMLYKASIKLHHTWGKYAQIISKIHNKDINPFINEFKKDASSSFFDYCFLTEVNHIPSRYSVGHKLLKEREELRKRRREELLKDPFYKTFPYVIIGASPYLTVKEIEAIFDSNLISEKVNLDRKGKNNQLEITCDIYESKNQRILYCQQLSGATGWTTKALDNLVKQLKSNADN